MAKFVPRLTCPSTTDKDFINYQNGGHATAIVIDKKTGFVLPNCVGWFNGRWVQLLGSKVNWNIPCCNAEDCYDYAKSHGFKVGSTPKLGAGIVWRKGKTHNEADGCGHIATVEKIYSNGDIEVSQSAYGGKMFYTSRITKASGYYFANGYTLVGFIYLPIEFDQDITEDKKPSTPVTPTTSKFKEKDVVKLKSGAKWSDGSTPASWVYNCNLTVKKVSGNILTVSKDGYTGGVTGTVKDTDVTLVNSATVSTPKPVTQATLTAKSYPDYPKGKGTYKVQKKPNDWNNSIGAYSVFSNAFSSWTKYKSKGYHIYDENWKQLD